METVTLYLYDREENGEPVFSLEPDPNGEDDGGRSYELPAHYFYRGGKLVTQKGEPCAVQAHNGRPLLVDTTNGRAYLMELEPKITHMREKQGLSQEAFAEALGVSQLTLYRFEHNEEEPHSAILSRMAQILHCDVLDLI